MKNTTAHVYTKKELDEALERLVRLGMTRERATELVRYAYLESYQPDTQET